MKTKAELLNELPEFIGTSAYHPFSILFKNVVLTDGAKYLAEEAGAYWLMDMIASWLPKVKDCFGVATLVKNKKGDGAKFSIANDKPADVVWAKQNIAYTDFPLDEIDLWVAKSGNLWVIYLPSEH